MQRQRFLTTLITIVLLMFVIPAWATYGEKLCRGPLFHCVKVKRGESWNKLFPNAHDRDIVMRINRLNTQIYRGMIIAVPVQLADADIMDFSPFPLKIDAPLEKLIIVDPVVLAWAAYDADGELIRWGPASGGANYCRDIEQSCRTRDGAFRIFSLGTSDCYSTKFPLPDGGAPMPYCMYFHNGQALHGEPRGLPGYNASHGCVRLYVNDAEWLRYDFVEGPNARNQFRGTQVIVRPYQQVVSATKVEDEEEESSE